MFTRTARHYAPRTCVRHDARHLRGEHRVRASVRHARQTMFDSSPGFVHEPFIRVSEARTHRVLARGQSVRAGLRVCPDFGQLSRARRGTRAALLLGAGNGEEIGWPALKDYTAEPDSDGDIALTRRSCGSNRTCD